VKFLVLLLLFVSCSKKNETVVSDDYVLVEFASKLEEDYQKLSGEEGLPPKSDDRQKK
jgi:hypothetical protein